MGSITIFCMKMLKYIYIFSKHFVSFLCRRSEKEYHEMDPLT
jgi:hypothetical protein